MVCNVITADKANRLFWLGRYAERVYISLHLLRRYYDSVIDGDISNLHEYYKCLGQEGDHCACVNSDFQMSQLYDIENECSIAKSLELSIDNGIVLRHDISTESLSYIQMSKALLDECRVRGEKNVAFMQPITDYMLAFFGSIDERVFDERIRKFLKIGKFIENIDLHIRFNYPFFRIEEAFNSLKDYLLREGDIVDKVALEHLEGLLVEEEYNQSASYKSTVLGYLGRLATV